MPDFNQTDPELKVPGGGWSHCGPVAVSNSLVWLSQQGYPRLLPELPEQAPGADAAALRRQQIDLIRTISAEPYMGTSRWSGTGPAGILRGLHRYVRRSGYQYRRLEYQGWRGHQRAFRTGVRRPELSWIRGALEEGGVAFIHVGWYTPVPRTEALKRGGGHWLTVVSVGKDERGAPDPNALVLHDPAPYAGDEPARVFVQARELTSGWLLDRGTKSEPNPSLPAKGYLSLEGGMHIKDEGNLAVMDGAIIMVLEPPSVRPKPVNVPH